MVQRDAYVCDLTLSLPPHPLSPSMMILSNALRLDAIVSVPPSTNTKLPVPLCLPLYCCVSVQYFASCARSRRSILRGIHRLEKPYTLLLINKHRASVIAQLHLHIINLPIPLLFCDQIKVTNRRKQRETLRRTAYKGCGRRHTLWACYRRRPPRNKNNERTVVPHMHGAKILHRSTTERSSKLSLGWLKLWGCSRVSKLKLARRAQM